MPAAALRVGHTPAGHEGLGQGSTARAQGPASPARLAFQPLPPCPAAWARPVLQPLGREASPPACLPSEAARGGHGGTRATLPASVPSPAPAAALRPPILAPGLPWGTGLSCGLRSLLLTSETGSKPQSPHYAVWGQEVTAGAGPGRSHLGKNGAPTMMAGGVPRGDGLRSRPGLGGRGWRPPTL